MPQSDHRVLRQRARVEDRDALLRSAEAAFEAGNHGEAWALAQRAVEAADRAVGRIPDDDRAAREVAGNARASARRLYALCALAYERSDEALQAAQEAVRIAQGAGAHREHAMAALALSEIAGMQNDHVEALRWVERARASAERAGDAATRRSALAELGWLLARMGDGERAREAIEEALRLRAVGQPPMRAFRVLVLAAGVHRAAGRYALALDACEQAEELAREAPLGETWPLVAVRLAVHLDLGAYDLVRAGLEANPTAPDAPSWRRAQRTTLEVALALAENERPDAVEHLAAEGLALRGLDAPSRLALTQLRAQALLARGRTDEAERVAIEVVTEASRGGSLAVASQAMAIAARATSRPETSLPRWLGSLALATNGTAARAEHEALAALCVVAEPIGILARTGLAIIRARLLDRAPDELRVTLKRSLRSVETRVEAAKQARRAEIDTTLPPSVVRAKEAVGVVGSSPPLLRAIVTLARAARSDSSLVITGETGSGKELFARLAHRLSPRAEGAFVAINCAAIPEQLLEAELFGHERGAYTGAERARSGLFVEAQGGALFLDEVGEMSPAMQAKLLRVLEQREVRPIGGTKARRVDVRVIAATHRDLGTMVSDGAFREDLFYRLAALSTRVPSLRERPEDIPAVARALLSREPVTARKLLDVGALAALSTHPWPGNVRELANVLRIAATLSEEETIAGDAIRDAIQSTGGRAIARSERVPAETSVATLRERHRRELRELVGRAIAAADGNKLRAARALGLSRQALYRILAELGTPSREPG